MSRSWPAPTRSAHKKFVEIEGWEPAAGATGKTGEHLRYQLRVADDTLRTRISHPPSAKHTYGHKRWSHILQEQVKVTEAEFWACVRDGELPQRLGPAARSRPPGPPIEVVNLLVTRVGLDEDEVRSMTREKAIERLNRYWMEGH